MNTIVNMSINSCETDYEYEKDSKCEYKNDHKYEYEHEYYCEQEYEDDKA